MTKKKNNMEMVGKVAFIVGLLLAVVAGLVPSVAGFAYLGLVLVALGLLVGFLNIAEKDVVTVLVALIALVTVGNATLNVIPAVSTYLIGVLENFVLFVGAAAFVVALKAILAATKK